MAEVKVKVGKKEADQQSVDKSKTVQNRKPEGGDVEGQRPTLYYVACPDCYTMGWVDGDTEYWTWVCCWNCGSCFTV